MTTPTSGPTGVPLPVAGIPVAFTVPEGDTPGQLLASRCRDCSTITFPPVRFCSRCTGRALEQISLGSEGTLHSWSTVYQDPGPSFVGKKPFTIVTVSLPEGIRVVSTLADDSPTDRLSVGLPLELTFVPVGSAADGATVYDFRFRPKGPTTEGQS